MIILVYIIYDTSSASTLERELRLAFDAPVVTWYYIITY